MTTYKLIYFDFPGGRGEAARLALQVAGVDWQDERIAIEDWPSRKPSTPFGGLPVLEVEGKGVFSQSNAILGYLGTQHDLLPKDAFAAAHHVAVMNAVEELRAQAATTARDDDDEKREAREAFVSGYFHTWCTNLSEHIAGPFVGGDEMSVADLKVYVAMRSYTKGIYDHIPSTVLEPFAKITALIAAVEAHPKVKAWLS